MVDSDEFKKEVNSLLYYQSCKTLNKYMLTINSSSLIKNYSTGNQGKKLPKPIVSPTRRDTITQYRIPRQ